MSRSQSFQATLGASTSIATKVPVGDTNEFNACEPCWWVVDILANGSVVDPRPGPTRAPQLGDLLAMPPRIAELKVSVEYTLMWSGAASSGFKHQRVFDAVPGRYHFFASTVNVELLGPADMVTYNSDPAFPSDYAILSPETIVGYIDVGISPSPPSNANTAQYTHRVTIPAGAPPASTQVPIPNGARRVQVFDTVAWTWLEPTQGSIAVAGGQSQAVLVPACSKIGPTAGAARTATVVFEVVL